MTAAGTDLRAEEPVGARRASPRNVAILLCCLFGLGVSTYLTLAHYNPAVTLVCSSTGAINCEKVTTSPQSMVFGIPVAVLGLVFFVAMLALNVPATWRSGLPSIAAARLGLAVSGIGFVFYLLYSELFSIHAICLWCSSVHVITFVIFCLVVTGWEEAVNPPG